MKIEDVAKNMNKPVFYRNRLELTEYQLTGCVLRKAKGKFYYTAELLDKNSNSVIIVPLEKVEAVGN